MIYSNELVLRILRDIDDGVFALDLCGRIVYINPQCEKMFGQQKQLLGKSYAEAFFDAQEERNDEFHQFILNAVYKKDQTHCGTVSFFDECGNKRYLRLASSFLRDETTAESTGIVMVISDVTETEVLKEISNMKLVERLNQVGYLIDYANVKERNPNGNVNRTHMAAELLEQGYVASIQEAFETILSDNGGFYEQPSRLQLMDVIKELRHIGVIPILAHPLQELTELELRKMLPIAIEAGLAGIETIHSSYTREVICLAEKMASEFKLLSSGGSDFHGSVKPDIFLGTGKGWLCVPASKYLDLQALQREVSID